MKKWITGLIVGLLIVMAAGCGAGSEKPDCCDKAASSSQDCCQQTSSEAAVGDVPDCCGK